MKQIIKTTLQRVIDKKLRGFSAKLVEDHIEVKGPNKFLDIFVFIRNEEVIIEIKYDHKVHTIVYEMHISLEELVRHVISDIFNIDRISYIRNIVMGAVNNS